MNNERIMLNMKEQKIHKILTMLIDGNIKTSEAPV